MKNILLFSVIMYTLTAMTAVKKPKIIFFGDSITEMATAKGGYIDRINSALIKSKHRDAYELTGAGISGNKVYDLYLRIDEDVLAKHPHTVVIYVGINDVWHKTMTGTGTDADKFEKFYTALIKKMQAKKIKVFVCTPSVIGEQKNNANQQDEDLDIYAALIKKAAAENNCGVIDLRNAFKEYESANNISNQSTGVLTTDGVHLNDAGNQLVAEKMMEALQLP